MSEKLEPILRVQDILQMFHLDPTRIEVDYQFDDQGELPENITKAFHFAKAAKIPVERKYGKLVFDLRKNEQKSS